MKEREPLSGPDAARIRFLWQQAVLMTLFAASAFGAKSVLRGTDLQAARWAVTAIPAALLIVWGWAFARMIRVQDEMMQMVHLRAVAISAGLVLFVATLWGLFERMLGGPTFPVVLLLPAFAVVYSGALFLQGIREP